MSILSKLGASARNVGLVVLLATAASAPAGAGSPAPTFSMEFSPQTIGPGSSAVLRFSITEVSGAPVSDLAFEHFLPAGLTLADPAGATSGCAGTLQAVAGGTTISLTGGAVAAFASCEIEALVTGTSVATYVNTTGDLTSSAGSSGPASADLVIAADRPGFRKSFSDSMTVLGRRERLTFTVDNSLNVQAATNLAFVDVLPDGLVIADPANLFNSCDASITSPFAIDYDGGILTAEPGSDRISLAFGAFPNAAAVDAGGSCTIGLDVVSRAAGAFDNISEPLSSAVPLGIASTSGRAVASMNSQGGSIVLIKEFLEDPVPPGDSVVLRFTLLNRNGTTAATDITFTDDLDATLPGLVASGVPVGNVCGAGSLLSGSSVLSLSGGQLDARSQCSFDVTLQVPAAATPGIYSNVTSAVEADFGGPEPVLGNAAGDDLFVFAAPRLTKTFIENPAPAGGTTTIEYTIENTSTLDVASELAFTDDLSTFLPIPLPLTLPAPGFCGATATATVIPLAGGAQGLRIQGGELAAAASCTFQVGVNLPPGLPPLFVTSASGPISGVIGSDPVVGNAAAAQLQILGAPLLTKTFIDDPVQPGDTVELEFTLSYGESATAIASGIAFTDDLNATLTGLVATGLPAADVCGAGSQIVGTTNLALTGASLLPGQTCSFRVTLQVPAGAAPGPYPNTTSAPTATVLGQTAIGLAASDNLDIASLVLEKEFVNDPALPGGTVTLRYTIRNDSATASATAIQFSDDLDDALPALAATGLPLSDSCGAGSALQGLSANRLLLFTGGSLAPGSSCTFTVDLLVPTGAASNNYSSTTSNLQATVDGAPLVLPPASDVLVVDNRRLQLAKTFVDDPAGPGDTVTLQFTLDNLDAGSAITGITFSDDLDAVLAGLQATGLPVNDVCGAGSTLSGSGLLSLNGATLPAAGQCVFSVTLQLPVSLPSLPSVTNITSEVGGLLGGLAVRGDPAIDELRLQNLRFEKSFGSLAAAGGTVTLDYTLTNPDPVNAASGLAFSDALNSVVPGLIAVGLPTSGVCGAGALVSGTGLVTLTDGSLPPNSSCSFSITLQLPAGAAPGSYPSTSSSLTSGGLEVAPPASATLTIEPAPLFAKAFAASPIVAGATTTLTFTVDNSASALAVTGLSFTDPLPAGLVVADPVNAVSTCDGMPVAAPGAGVIEFTGGTVGAGATCTLSIDVRALEAGSLTNTTSALNSSSGISAPAIAGITVQPAPVPVFGKSFTPTSITLGEISELALTIDNSAALLAATGLNFNDVFPAGMQVADPPNLFNDCGGSVTAPAGAASVQLGGGSVAAAGLCQVRVAVTATAAGSLVNTTSALGSSLGSSAPASATLTVRAAPGFTKAFAPDMIAAGAISRLSFTIDNSGETVSAEQLTFDDPLPTGLLIASPANTSSDCTGGTLSAPAGGALISYAGGSVAAGAICTIAVDVLGNQPGTWLNTTSTLESSLGSSAAASATIVVDEDSDGVPAAVEDQAPNGGDGNNDGIPDRIQNEVASLPAFDGSSFITVVARGGCSTLNQVVALSPGNQTSPAPADLDFPFGLVGFALPCENAVVDIIFHDAQAGFGDRYFKFGPTVPGDLATEQWYSFAGATRSGNVWTLTLADNAPGDSSGDDGIINDPGGPALQVLAVPATGQTVLVLLALLLLLAARQSLKHKPEHQ